MTHTNAQVAAAFIRGESAQSGSMHSNGAVLYSYATPIARHADAGTIIVSCQQHSVTTTRHHSELWSAAYAAGYDGPAHWQGDPKRSRKDERADTVPFHDEDFPGTRYGRAKETWNMERPKNVSNHDARAVVWTFSQDAYDTRADNREWYESRNHCSVNRKEKATA